MKTIIAGSRRFAVLEKMVRATMPPGTKIKKILMEALCREILEGFMPKIVADSGFEVDEVVSGGAKMTDKAGEVWATDQNIPIKPFQPDWTKGRQGGILRNIEMGAYAEALIAIWDGISAGTRHMISEMIRLDKPVYLFVLSATAKDANAVAGRIITKEDWTQIDGDHLPQHQKTLDLQMRGGGDRAADDEAVSGVRGEAQEQLAGEAGASGVTPGEGNQEAGDELQGG